MSIYALDRELNEWRDSIPIEVRPDNQIVCDDLQLLPIILLHYSYYSCLIAVHGGLINHGLWTSECVKDANASSNIDLNQRIHESEKTCVVAACRALSLLDYYKGDRMPPLTW